MLDLSSYLDKFKEFKHPSGEKEKIAKLILETIFIEIKSSEIEVKGQTLYLTISSVTKSEIFLRKEELLEVFKTHFNKPITDIR